MSRAAMIARTISVLQQLPEEKAATICSFGDFMMQRFDEEQLRKGMQQLTTNTTAFEFLKDEEDLCAEADLKEVYHD